MCSCACTCGIDWQCVGTTHFYKIKRLVSVERSFHRHVEIMHHAFCGMLPIKKYESNDPVSSAKHNRPEDAFRYDDRRWSSSLTVCHSMKTQCSNPKFAYHVVHGAPTRRVVTPDFLGAPEWHSRFQECLPFPLPVCTWSWQPPHFRPLMLRAFHWKLGVLHASDVVTGWELRSSDVSLHK